MGPCWGGYLAIITISMRRDAGTDTITHGSLHKPASMHDLGFTLQATFPRGSRNLTGPRVGDGESFRVFSDQKEPSGTSVP